MDIYAFLEKVGVGYEKYEHPPVFTCEEAREQLPDLGAAETKNLFLKDKKGRHHFLVVMGYDTKVELKEIARRLDVKSLSFCSPDRLRKYLGVEPGSVTMLGLACDTEKVVELVIEEQLWAQASFCCHPLVNTATLVIGKPELEKFFRATGHGVKLVDFQS